MVVVAALIFALAYYSPVTTSGSDPAIALVASQALIDHHSIRLDPYRDRDDLAYDLDTDWRVRSYDGAYYPNSLGVPVLSTPAVWIANRMGLHMLVQTDEFAVQNFLSALACALLFVLWFRICRLYLGGAASVAVATVSMLGTSAMSTGATGLWNSDYSLIFVSLALLHLARRDEGRVAGVNLPYLGALVALGFVCRPSTGIFGVAVLVYFLGEANRRVAVGAAVTLAATGLAVIVPALVPLPWMAGHYAPARLRFTQPLGTGLYGVLLSPSRGLFVFSPFLGVVAAAGIRNFRWLRHDRLLLLCTVWVGLHTLAVATNDGRWWGGHSFGPRMLVDLIPGFVVLTCIVGRGLGARPQNARRLWMAAYLTLAAAGILVHTGQGLFNQAAKEWNIFPNIDDDPELAMDWRYPQFMASERLLEARRDDYELREVAERRGLLVPYAPGDPVSFDSAEVIFVHWWAAEEEWRWTRGERSSLMLRLPQLDPTGELHLLEIFAGSLGPQSVGVFVNGAAAGQFRLTGFDPVRRRLPVQGHLLVSGGENIIEFRVSDPSSIPGDRRQLGMSLRQLRLFPLAAENVEVSFADDPFFEEGFSEAEAGWRWTDETRARLAYPVGAVTPEIEYLLTIRGRGLGEQRVALRLNGEPIGLDVVGSEPVSITQRFPGTLLLPNRLNEIELTLPDAVAPPGDPRRLGFAVVSVGIAPAANDSVRRRSAQAPQRR